MPDVTELLARWRAGEPRALEELMPVVYGELYRLARLQMRRERPDHTLQPTALVHEAYVRLVSGDATFENRAHFYGAAAQAMRRILVDHARRRRTVKRTVAEEVDRFDARSGIDLRLDLVALDEALDRLAEVAAQPAKVVELRYFGGLSIEQTAAVLDVSPATVKRHWAFARAWLHRALVNP